MYEISPIATNDAAADAGCQDEERSGPNFHQYQAVAAVILGISLGGMFVRPVIGSRSIALIYLLGVVVAALFVGRGATLFAAAMSGLFWDFCFLEPIGKLHIDNVQDAFMFGTFLVVALIVGQLTAGIRAREKRERIRQIRSTALYRLTGNLAQATNLDSTIYNAVQQTEATFAAGIALLLPDSTGELSYQTHPASTYDITGPEQRVADWVFENRQMAGQFTGNFAHVDTFFVPLVASGRPLGVMGLNFKKPASPTCEQRRLLEIFCQHLAQALNRHRMGAEAENGPKWMNPSASIRVGSP